MNKNVHIVVLSVCLVIAAIILYLFTSGRSDMLDMDLVNFFSGFSITAGLVGSFALFFKRKKA